MDKMDTAFTQMMGCRYPIIAAPMFLVSNPEMVIQTSLAGGVGTFPTLNCRSLYELEDWILRIKEKLGDLPWGVNLILHKSNKRLEEDKKIVLKHKVPLIISSLGKARWPGRADMARFVRLTKDGKSAGHQLVSPADLPT